VSGKKQYHIDMSEWFRRQISKPLSRVVGAALADPAVADAVRRQTGASVDRDLRSIQDRQRGVEQVVGQLSEQTRQLERETNRRMREHAERTEQRLRATSGQLRDELRDQLSAQERSLRAEIADERRRRQDAISTLQRQLTDIAHDREQAAGAARAWLADAQAMHDLIEDTLPHERHAPGKLAGLGLRLATAQRNIEEGRPEAALAVVQETFHALSDLRVDLELRHRDWVVARAEAAQALLVVEGLLQRDADLPMRAPDGRELEGVRFDLGHWSKGELALLREEVAEAVAAVRDSANDLARPMSTEDLRAVKERRAPQYERRWEEIVERAQTRLLASQLRVNVADAVVTTLDQVAGYVLEDGAYAGEDQRAAFYAKLCHPNGNEIVVEVAPAADDTAQSTMRILSYDHDTVSEEQRQARAREIATRLRAQGLGVADPKTEPGAPDPRFLDLEELRTQASATAVRPDVRPGG
jgi:hypothetical protein